MVGSLLIGLALAAAAPATAAGERGCGERAEPSAPDAAQVRAPLRFFDDRTAEIPARELRPRDGRYATQKLAVDVAAGNVVTLGVAARSRTRLALVYDMRLRRPTRLRDGQRTVRFTACPADEPMFSGPGVVGPRTAFPGAVIVTGPQCAHFTVRVAGQSRVRRLRVGIGRRC